MFAQANQHTGNSKNVDPGSFTGSQFFFSDFENTISTFKGSLFSVAQQSDFELIDLCALWSFRSDSIVKNMTLNFIIC